MKTRILVGAICAILAFLLNARADILSLKKALLEIGTRGPEADRDFDKIVNQGFEIIPDLLTIADNQRNAVDERYNALRAIGAIAYRNRASDSPARTNLQGAVPVLLRCMHDNESLLASHAALCFGVFGDYAKPAIPELIAGIKSPIQGIRAGSIWSLNGLGADAQEALPALKIALNDPDMTVRTVAAETIAKLDGYKSQQEAPLNRLTTIANSNSAPAGLEISGTCEIPVTFEIPGAHARPRQGTFSVTIDGQKWKVRVKELGSDFDYFEAGANDPNEHFLYTCFTNRLAGVPPPVLEKISVGSGIADLGQVPTAAGSMMLPPVWLAYCSASYLEFATDKQLLPVFPFFPPNEKPKLAADWTIAPNSGGLPSNIVWFHKGSTNTVFRVLSFKKVGDKTLPESFMIERYMSGRPNFTYTFHATNFNSAPRIAAGPPALPGHVDVRDHRCPELDEVNYVLTTKQWPTTAEIRGKAAFQKAWDNQKAENKKPQLF